MHPAFLFEPSLSTAVVSPQDILQPLTPLLTCCCRTVTDVEVNPLGLIIAVISVLSSSMQQIMCGAMQRKYQLSSHQLLSNTAHIQASACHTNRHQHPFAEQVHAAARVWSLAAEVPAVFLPAALKHSTYTGECFVHNDQQQHSIGMVGLLHSAVDFQEQQLTKQPSIEGAACSCSFCNSV